MEIKITFTENEMQIDTKNVDQWRLIGALETVLVQLKNDILKHAVDNRNKSDKPGDE